MKKKTNILALSLIFGIIKTTWCICFLSRDFYVYWRVMRDGRVITYRRGEGSGVFRLWKLSGFI